MQESIQRVPPAMIRLDITGLANVPGDVEVAAAVFMPPALPVSDHPVVVVAYPGGTYTWRYYHLEVPGRSGYSFAQHLAASGCVVVACDHIGIGASSPVPSAEALTADAVLAADRAT